MRAEGGDKPRERREGLNANKFIFGFLILIVGVSIGYWWRMVQTEGTFNQEIQIIRSMNTEIKKDLSYLDGRLLALEGGKRNVPRLQKKR